MQCGNYYAERRIRRSFVLLISVIIIININIQNGGFNYEETNFIDSTIHSNPNGV
jgi:hypothetical protein